MKYKIPKKKTVSRTVFECLSRFECLYFFCLLKWNLLLDVWWGECWASFPTPLPSDGIHQQFGSLLPSHKQIRHHFFDTKTSPTRLLSLGIYSTTLWRAVAFWQVTGHFPWENRDPELRLDVGQRVVSPIYYEHRLTVNRAESFWKLQSSPQIYSHWEVLFTWCGKEVLYGAKFDVNCKLYILLVVTALTMLR